MLTDEPPDGRRQIALASSVPVGARFSSALSILYFARTAVSLTWVLIVSASASTLGPASSPGPLIWALLVLYPVTDAIATAADIHTTPRVSQTIFQRLSPVTSLLAAGAIAGTMNRNFATTIAVFGVWAIASGAIQLIVAIRRNTLIRAQWFMIISGAGSVFAGTTFLDWAGTASDGIRALVQYSTGGALWYTIAATWLAASARRLRIGSRTEEASAQRGQPAQRKVQPSLSDEYEKW